MKSIVLLLALSLCAGAASAQGGKRERREGLRQSEHMSQDDRRRLREDVDSARGNYGRREAQRAGPRDRQERMGPQERESLRRDVQDANRAMKKR